METKNSQTAVVTGAASGIGRGIARAAADLGMNVVICDRDEQGLQNVVRELDPAAHRVLGLVTDVSDPLAMSRLAEAAWERFGSVELVISNAGVEIGGKSWELSHDEWKRTIDVNLMGPVNCIRAFLPRMISAGKPAHVAVVSSLGALCSIGGQAPYMASKHAAQALCESLYLELQRHAPFIRVSSVLPGSVKTQIWQNALGAKNDRGRQTMIKLVSESGLDPELAGQTILAQILKGEFWVTTDFEMMSMFAKMRGEFMVSRRSPFWHFDPYAE